jgi:BASS family bile acid:Na+ symporter
MNATELFQAIGALSGLVFVVTSMLAMGLSLTMAQILEPLKNALRVILALLANFLLVPLLAYAITALIPLDESLRIGLIVMATAAGAPFLPKLVEGARGDAAFGVGLMVLLMVVTIAYVPLVLPLLLPGVEVDPWEIAQSLIFSMLIPLTIGLLIKSHWPDTADHWGPVMNKISSVAILVLLVVGLGMNIDNIVGFLGTGGILALLLFVIGSLAIGFLLGGRDPAFRSVMGLGTAQRNLAAAVMVTAKNFTEGDTMAFVLTAGILLLLVLLPTAKWLGARQEAAASTDTAATE